MLARGLLELDSIFQGGRYSKALAAAGGHIVNQVCTAPLRSTGNRGCADCACMLQCASLTDQPRTLACIQLFASTFRLGAHTRPALRLLQRRAADAAMSAVRNSSGVPPIGRTGALAAAGQQAQQGGIHVSHMQQVRLSGVLDS